MNRIKLLFALFVLLTNQVSAQNLESASEDLIPQFDQKNNVKLNLFSLPLSNFSVQYERGLTRKWSVALGLRYQPSIHIPFRKEIRERANLKASDAEAIDFLENAQYSNWAVTPELRYYLGKKPLNGFYLAPFARYSNYQLKWDYTYVDDLNSSHDIAFTGKANSITAGLLLGAQWHIGEHFLIDWWMIGPSIGSINIDIDGVADLSMLDASQQTTLAEKLSKIYDNVKVNVNDNGAKASSTQPFAGVRTGLCIGFTF